MPKRVSSSYLGLQARRCLFRGSTRPLCAYLRYVNLLVTSRSKSLSPERNESARAFVRELVRAKFDGNTLAAAKAFGLSDATLYDFLAGKRGAGLKLLEAVSRYSRVQIPKILGMEADTVALEIDVSVPPQLSVLAGWAEAAGSARDFDEAVPEWAWDAVGRCRLAASMKVSPRLVLDLAYVLTKHGFTPKRPAP
jgi:hypothetical protein